jgi:hypothetical protein
MLRSALLVACALLLAPRGAPAQGPGPTPAQAAAPEGEPAPDATGRISGPVKEVELDEVEEVVVPFETFPAGAAVFVDRELRCPSTPCSRAVPAGRHEVRLEKEGYDPTAAMLEVGRGTRVKAKLLRSTALLAVETTPPGLPVSIDGKPAGRSPLPPREVAPGPHKVLVDDPCWVLEGELVAWKKGEERTVRLAPRRRLAGLKLRAEDDQGDALEGVAVVDGAPLGAVPGSYRLPLCSERLEVRLPTGEVWSEEVGRLRLQEGQARLVTATFRASSAGAPAMLPAAARSREGPDPVPPATSRADLSNGPGPDLLALCCSTWLDLSLETAAGEGLGADALRARVLAASVGLYGLSTCPRTPSDWSTIVAGGADSGCSFAYRGYELSIWPIAVGGSLSLWRGATAGWALEPYVAYRHLWPSSDRLPATQLEYLGLGGRALVDFGSFYLAVGFDSALGARIDAANGLRASLSIGTRALFAPPRW